MEITNAPRADHAQYISSWLTVLKGDEKAIFTAASFATRAVDYLNGLQPPAAQSAPEDASAIANAPERPEPNDGIVTARAPKGPR